MHVRRVQAASGDIVQNNGFRGYTVKNGGKPLIVGGTILANVDSGAVAVSGSNLTIQNATIQSNGVDGIRVARLGGETVRRHNYTQDTNVEGYCAAGRRVDDREVARASDLAGAGALGAVTYVDLGHSWS